MIESEEKLGKTQAKKFASVKRTLTQRLFYFAVHLASQFVAVFIFEFRCFGRDNIPGPGGGLILSTHQSTIDPVMVGLSFNERLNYLARKSLFDNRVFATLIRLLDAIELDRERGGLAGLKEAMKRLKRGEKVLIFPEGTRCSDGHVAPVKPGFVSLAQRTRTPLIPVAISGAFEVLPRNSKLPRRYPVRVAVGPLISNADLEGKTEHEILGLVQQRLLSADAVARGHAR